MPQGSILGPLLFLIYINDVVNSSPVLSYILFADDTNIFYSHPCLNTLIRTLNIELTKVKQWFDCNKLSLNIKKTNFIHFTTRNAPENINIDIKIDTILLEQKESTKFLGVYLDKNLNCKTHIQKITSSISRSLGILCKLKDMLPFKTLLVLYNALTLPHISYCNTVWGNSTKSNTNIILHLQKKAMRICTGSHYLANTDPLFHQLNTLKVNDINVIQTACFMYRFSVNLLPSNFNDIFSYNRNIHNYPTRISNNFHITNPRISLTHRSIRHHGPDIWNSLPEHIKQSKSLSTFKTKVKNYLISNYSH